MEITPFERNYYKLILTVMDSFISLYYCLGIKDKMKTKSFK